MLPGLHSLITMTYLGKIIAMCLFAALLQLQPVGVSGLCIDWHKNLTFHYRTAGTK